MTANGAQRHGRMRRRLQVVAQLGIVVALLGAIAYAFVPRPPGPAAIACDALEISQPARTVGAYLTTLGSAQALMPSRHPTLYPELDREHPVVLCYMDVHIAKGPPYGGPAFDRALYVIIDGESEMLAAGYRDSLPARAP